MEKCLFGIRERKGRIRRKSKEKNGRNQKRR